MTARTEELKALTRRQPARTLALALAKLNEFSAWQAKRERARRGCRRPRL